MVFLSNSLHGLAYQRIYWLVIWALLDSFGSFWALLGSFGIFWALMDSFGSIWVLWGSFGHFWVFLGSFGPFWALLGLLGLYSAIEQVRAGPDFPIVAPSLSWSLYTKLHTTSTTTVLEKSQLLKGFQVEQKKNTRVARPKSHVTPTVAPNTPKNPHYYPPKSHTVHILLFTSLIIASFYRHALVIIPL